jgi:hypothetical protein
MRKPVSFIEGFEWEFGLALKRLYSIVPTD